MHLLESTRHRVVLCKSTITSLVYQILLLCNPQLLFVLKNFFLSFKGIYWRLKIQVKFKGGLNVHKYVKFLSETFGNSVIEKIVDLS